MRAAAQLPPPGLPGLDARWSRLVETPDEDGTPRTWHVLDNGGTLTSEPVGTLLCVHGNPTWSYLWRSLLAAAAERDARGEPSWRVVAVDQLDMGWSERTGTVRRLQRRIDDLGALTDALGLTGPVVSVGHDWGGVISLGWALAHREQLCGVVLTNTAVAQPEGAPVPPALALARSVLPLSTVHTPAFVATTLALASPPLAADVRRAYLEPYASRGRRAAVGGFVDDIPLAPDHPSTPALSAVAEGARTLTDVPALILWGPRDPVFRERYLHDLRDRLPHADVHRFEGAGHLLAEDADVAGTVFEWLDALTDPAAPPPPAPAAARVPLWSALQERAGDPSPAVVELGASGRTVSWSLLARRIDELAAGLADLGVRRGDRVALLVPPGADLTAALYACLRLGAPVVVADAGLGLRGLTRAVRGAAPAYVIGIPRALAAARALGWPGTRIAAGPVDAATVRLLGARTTLAGLARRGSGSALPEPPPSEADAAVLFTSGSTGPAKGAVYTVAQLEAVRDALSSAYLVTGGTRLVAAFAPFALFGPALGAVSAVPDMDVTAPGTLTAAALADAVAAVDATTVFASPAALVSVVATADRLTPAQVAALGGVETLLSAGAPVPAALLRRVLALMPRAQAHTPYGMTEALPVTDVTLAEVEEAGPGAGVCVGRPLAQVEVAVSPLDPAGGATGTLTAEPYVLGEIAVRGAHVKDRYDALWRTERASRRDAGWHRTGDVGHLDGEGRLWVEGRLAHLVLTADRPLPPVGVEQRVESLPAVARAALVGVGPAGTQQPVVVVEPLPPVRRGGLAPLALADEVRAVAGVEVAAVLAVRELPTDIRHNSKIDRSRVAAWASRVLAGERVGAP
ncbi:alpha/beta fold hydrolase [Motilibacter aurantiacus]|uniref:alpha/beta fold hydrolase n=1 Tax=Motilibacter aurantiacus TaxID=2714955 RepID=UPI002F2B2407